MKIPRITVNLGLENRDIPHGTRIRILEMNEAFYRKHYDWIPSLYISKFEIIPRGSKPSEKIKEYEDKVLGRKRDLNDDDLLF